MKISMPSSGMAKRTTIHQKETHMLIEKEISAKKPRKKSRKVVSAHKSVKAGKHGAKASHKRSVVKP